MKKTEQTEDKVKETSPKVKKNPKSETSVQRNHWNIED
jgi:hypothetical protein